MRTRRRCSPRPSASWLRGGRIGVADIVANDELTREQRAECGDYVGCLAGTLSFREYRQGLQATGFAGVEITSTHSIADGMHSAIVRATKPTVTADQARATGTTTATGACCGVTSCCTPAEQVTDPSTTAV